jgi:hypothetical protein
VTPPSDRENGTVLALAVCDASPDPKIENNEPPASGIAAKLAPFAMPFGAMIGVVLWADATAAANIRKETAHGRIERMVPSPTIGDLRPRDNARDVKEL